jgi:hypothetical protein
MKRTKEPKKVPRNRGDWETSSLAHRSYHFPTYFLEDGEFCAFGVVSFVRLCSGGFCAVVWREGGIKR